MNQEQISKELAVQHQSLHVVAIKQFNERKWSDCIYTLCSMVSVEASNDAVRKVDSLAPVVAPPAPKEDAEPVA